MGSLEQQLRAFLDSLPEWRRKWLQYEAPFSPDWISKQSTSASREEIEAAKQEMCTWVSNSDEDLAIREQYETLLRLIPSRWREYRNKLKKMAVSDLPRGKPGRRLETERAERIWKLKAEGNTSKEIQQKLASEGESYSLTAIESYLKARRRKPRK